MEIDMNIWMLVQLGRSRHRDMLAVGERARLARLLPQRAGPLRRIAAITLHALGVRALVLARRMVREQA